MPAPSSQDLDLDLALVGRVGERENCLPLPVQPIVPRRVHTPVVAITRVPSFSGRDLPGAGSFSRSSSQRCSLRLRQCRCRHCQIDRHRWN